MKCVICKNGETQAKTATVTLESGNMTLVIKQVPADVCGNCGEEYLSSDVSEKLLKEADGAQKSGVQVDVRTFGAA